MNICEFLGLKPLQEFKIKGDNSKCKYRFNENDEREYYNKVFGVWKRSADESLLTKLLHDDSLIEVIDDKVDIGMSFHDVVVINGLNKINGNKIVRIERDVNDDSGKVRFVRENGESLEVFYYNVKMDFLEDFDCDVFEVEYLDGGYIRVWGC